MVFDKQHLSLFVALAFLLVYTNAVPATSITNEKNIQRLRGDLHQFIELILNCISNSKTAKHSEVDPSQLKQFKQITNSLQEDVGLPLEASTQNTEDDLDTRKMDPALSGSDETSNEVDETKSEEPSQEVDSSSETNDDSTNVSKETTDSGSSNENTSNADANHDSDEKENQSEFDLGDSDSHGYTPRSFSLENLLSGGAEKPISTTHPDFSSNTNHPPQDGSDIGLRILKSGSREDTTDGDQSQETSASTLADNTSEEEAPSAEEAPSKEAPSKEPPLKEAPAKGGQNSKDLFSFDDKIKSRMEKLRQNLANPIKQLKQKYKPRKKTGDESPSSNESKDKSENNTEEIQVRNLIQELPTDSSVHPYDALHIYGIQKNGPINKVVFEGGEHHPPRPLTVKESNHLKEFIKMVIKTNTMRNPIASFPPTEEEISSRSGFDGKKSPWASKPVPLELV